MVVNCDCVGNGAFVDHSGDVSKYGPKYNSGGSYPAIYDNMSFQHSLFDNSTFANTYGGLGCLGCYGFGYGMPYGGYGPYGGNTQNYYDWMFQNQQFNMDYNRRSVELGLDNEMAVNGPDRIIMTKMQNLEARIKGDDQRHIKEAWDDYVEAFGRKYPQYADDPAMLASTAREYYEQYIRTKNNDPYFTMAAQLQQYAKPIFVRKLINTVSFGLFMKGSAEETARDITGTPMSDKAQNHAAAGKAAGVITGLGALAGLIKFRGPIWSAVKNNKVVAGILAIGALVGLVSSARNK